MSDKVVLHSAPPPPDVDSTERREISECFDLAEGMLQECKAAANIPALNTAIYLFRHAIHLLRRNGVNSLHEHRRLTACLDTFASTFLIRFSYTGEFTDVVNAFGLRRGAHRDPGTRGNLEAALALDGFVIDGSEVGDDVSDIINCATTILADFTGAIDLSTVETIIYIHREALARRALSDPDMWRSLLALSEAVLIRFHSSRRSEDLDEVVALRWQVHLIQPNRVMCLCAALMTGVKADLSVGRKQLMDAIQLFDLSVTSNKQAMDSCVSGNNFLQMFRQSGRISDLDAGISRLEEAEHQLSWGHEKRAVVANNLAASFYKRFEMRSDEADLKRAIELWSEDLALQRALESNPVPNTVTHSTPATVLDTSELRGLRLIGQPDLIVTLNNLTRAIETRFQKAGEMADLERAIELYNEVLALPPHRSRDTLPYRLAHAVDPIDGKSYANDSAGPDPSWAHYPSRSYYLHHLGQLFHKRFNQKADISDLDSAVNLYREAIALQSVPYSDRDALFSNLGAALDERFEISGTISELDEAIEAHRKALTLLSGSHPQHDIFLYNQARSQYQRWTRLANVEDLDSSIECYRGALALQSPPHPQREQSLVGLGKALRERVDKRGDMSDLHDDIEIHRELLSLRPAPDPHRKHSLRNLATGLHKRCRLYQQSATDLDRAIELQREAVTLVPAPDPDRGVYLDTLASLLSTRFKQRGDFADLDTVISLYREAITVLPVAHFACDRPLGNLSAALYMRYESNRNRSDLELAIDFCRQALTLRPTPHPDRADSLANLAGLLQLRMEESKDAQDINNVIDLYHEALGHWKVSHPNYTTTLINLALTLAIRFQQSGDPTDLESSSDSIYEALHRVPEPSPVRGNALSTMATTLLLKYKQSGESHYLDESMSTFHEASTYIYGSVPHRLFIAQQWAKDAEEVGHTSALEAYRIAISLLPQLAMLGLDIYARRRALTTPRHGLASKAADCAIRFDDLNTAVELLETGRSVFWSQALQLRTPLDELRLVDPELADKASAILVKLEEGSHRNLSSRSILAPYSQEYISLDVEAQGYSDLNVEWLQTLQNIRQRKGLEHFLLPKPFEALRYSAIHGPVVILNASGSHATALIITLDKDVQCLPLPDITFWSAMVMARLLRVQGLPNSSFLISKVLTELYAVSNRGELSATEIRLYGHMEGAPNLNHGDFLRFLLGELWTSIGKPVLSALKLTKSANPPRIWWCPTGPFCFLPIHAAGVYEENNEHCLSDYVISSYAPTLSTLLDRPTHTATRFKMTAVIQPETTGFASLWYTREELSKIEARVPPQWLTSLGRNSQTAVDTALFHLHQSSIAHFACHGVQDSANPLDSGLLLTDGRLKVSQIMERANDSPNETSFRNRMSLAFLSACETAKGDEELPDEAMHLASALLFAGFRGVVATMWTIADPDGPKVADDFYEYLFRQCDAVSNPPSRPDLTKAAEALHVAIGNLRKEKGISLSRWVPFISFGRTETAAVTPAEISHFAKQRGGGEQRQELSSPECSCALIRDRPMRKERSWTARLQDDPLTTSDTGRLPFRVLRTTPGVDVRRSKELSAVARASWVAVTVARQQHEGGEWSRRLPLAGPINGNYE
ncbi:CHAT domain-containing protein [Mycena epipterygia]|nr:CHAT domain-containing protein [Mycena epipterygia]